MSDYFTNKFGVKTPKHASKAFIDYHNESISLELFLMFILLNQHTKQSIKEKKELLKSIYEDPQNNKLTTFLDSNKSDIIFDSNSHETYFGQLAYTRITDNCLSYFKEILVEIIKSKPEILRSSEKVTLEYIFSFTNYTDLIQDITLKNIERLFYGGINEIKKYFKDKIGIELFTNEIEEKNFNQFIKQRNLIVHNRGIISSEFSKEFSNPNYEYKIGNTLVFNYINLSTINGTITNIITDLDLKLCKKFGLQKYNLD